MKESGFSAKVWNDRFDIFLSGLDIVACLGLCLCLTMLAFWGCVNNQPIRLVVFQNTYAGWASQNRAKDGAPQEALTFYDFGVRFSFAPPNWAHSLLQKLTKHHPKTNSCPKIIIFAGFPTVLGSFQTSLPTLALLRPSLPRFFPPLSDADLARKDVMRMKSQTLLSEEQLQSTPTSDFGRKLKSNWSNWWGGGWSEVIFLIFEPTYEGLSF